MISGIDVSAGNKSCYKALTSCQSIDNVPTLLIFPKKAGPTPVKKWNWIYASLWKLRMLGFSARIIPVFLFLFPGLNYFIVQEMEGGYGVSPVGEGAKWGYDLKMGGPTLRSPSVGISQIHQQFQK